MAYDFKETNEQKLLRDSIRKFALETIAPTIREFDDKEEFSLETTNKMAELGLMGMIIPEEYGGAGYDIISYMIVLEEIAKIDSSHAGTIAVNNGLGAYSFFAFGTEEQKRTFLPKICGEGLWSFGLTEPESGSDARASKTTAVFDEKTKEWVINGSKIWITNSATPISKGITVQAVTGKLPNGSNELSCFIVPIGTPGLKVHPVKGKMMWRSSGTGDLFFDNLRIPQNYILGKKGDGFKIMMQLLDGGRLAIGAVCLGMAQGAYELALKYAKERETFGKKIIRHQAIAFKLAEMATKIEAARAFLYKVAWLRQNNLPFTKEAAMVKLFCSEVCEFCAREGQQIFGGYGLMKEYPIERFYRDSAFTRIGEGTSEILKLVIGRDIEGA